MKNNYPNIKCHLYQARIRCTMPEEILTPSKSLKQLEKEKNELRKANLYNE